MVRFQATGCRFQPGVATSTLRIPMGKTLRRYLLRQIGGAFAAGIAVFTFVLFVARVVDLLEMIFARGVPGTLVLRLLACIVPTFLEATLPMAFVLGVVVAVGRLGADGELLALRAAGIDVFQMLRPVLLVALAVSSATLALAMTARPWGHREFERTAFEIAKTRASAALRPRFFNNDFESMVVYVDRIDPDSGTLLGVVLADERSAAHPMTVFAKAGRVGGREDSGALFLQLLDGTSVIGGRTSLDYDVTSFRSLDVTLQLRTSSGKIAAGGQPGVMDWSELQQARAGAPGDAGGAREATIELHRRLAISAAPLVLALLALPLGMQPTRSAHSQGTGVSIVLILAYYALLSLGIALARSGSLPAAASLWLPNVVLAVAAAWALKRTADDRALWPALHGRTRLGGSQGARPS